MCFASRPANGPNAEVSTAPGVVGIHLRVADGVFFGVHVRARPTFAAQLSPLKSACTIGGRVLFVHREQVLVVLARDRIAIDVGGTVVGRQLRRRPVPDVGRDVAAEGVEIRRIVGEARRIVRRICPCGSGPWAMPSSEVRSWAS